MTTALSMTTAMPTKSSPIDEVLAGIGEIWHHDSFPTDPGGRLESVVQNMDGTITTKFKLEKHTVLMSVYTWRSAQRFLEVMRLVGGTHTAVKADLSRFPHTCPRCGSAAYVGATAAVDCYNVDCVTKKR